MPELPEVETTRRGIEPFLLGQTILTLCVREPRLRWPVPPELRQELSGRAIQTVSRRGKYLLIGVASGSVIMHLGMSGSLSIVSASIPAGKFDHIDIILTNGDCLRLRDPRRFGSVLWSVNPAQHALLRHLGPEPLENDFSGNYLFNQSRGRIRAVRDFIMDSHIVAGIGNIYANEALFLAGIDPRRRAGKISRQRYDRLAQTIRVTLEDALAAGGTTLRDFRRSDGTPGYFQQSLKVYGRKDRPCPQCARPIRGQMLGSRSAFFCISCQN